MTSPALSETATLDAARLREDFPILQQEVNGHPLVYLDSGATSQKPRQVLQAEYDFLTRSNAAVHRGAHTLAAEATDLFEDARATVARFVGARDEQLVWTSGATMGLNLVAYAIGNATLGRGAPASARFALQPGDDPRPPSREITLHLTGNMERFIWGFDGKKFSQAEPIRLKLGERVRFTLINDTMMEHPIHLHGLWSELENGYGAHRPYKHTINVKPGIATLVSACPFRMT